MCACRGFIAGVVATVAAGAVIFSLGFSASQSGSAPPKVPVTPSKEKPGSVPPPAVPKPPAELEMTPEMILAMEMMLPGPEHLWLAEKVGDWTFTGQMAMGPGVTEDIRGTASYRMILDGRFLTEVMKTTLMGQPMEGVGTIGYSRATKQFQMSWVDSMGTTMTTGVGQRSADGKTLTGTWDMLDPMTNKMMKARSVETHTDANHFSFAMYTTGPDGKEMQMFEFNYTRKAP